MVDIVLIVVGAVATAVGLWIWNKEEDDTDRMVLETFHKRGRHD